MERVERWSINDSGLMSDEHALAVIETVDDKRSCIAKSDLENRMLVLMPPFLYTNVRSTLLDRGTMLVPRTQLHGRLPAPVGVQSPVKLLEFQICP